jgi:hypothetical protein
VADEARTLGHCDVLALNNLGMAARAAKPFASSQISEMNFVVEDDFFKFDLAFQQSFLMASGAETTLIRDFGPRLGFQVKLGPITAELHQSLNFCP